MMDRHDAIAAQLRLESGVAFYKYGATLSEAASMASCGRNRLLTRLTTLGLNRSVSDGQRLKRRRVYARTPERVQLAGVLRLKGWLYREIGGELGIKRDSARNYAAEAAELWGLPTGAMDYPSSKQT